MQLTACFFFIQMVKRVFKDFGNTFTTVFSVVKQPSGFFRSEIVRFLSFGESNIDKLMYPSNVCKNEDHGQ